MLRLERAILQAGNSAPIVPNMFPCLADKQVAIRRGEVSMIAGPPGAGKSTLALALAVRAKVGTLYVSADTHAHTMSLRLLAMLSNADQAQVEPAMLEFPQWATDTLKQADYIRWCFDSAPSVATIETELAAYEELHGTTPEMLVIDNLVDCVGGEGDEWGQLRGLLKDFKWLAREHDTALVVLHHTSEAFQLQPEQCPPMRALQGKVGQTPALIVTVSNQQSGTLFACAVKNRYGPSSPNGGDVVWLGYQPASMQVYDPAERAR